MKRNKTLEFKKTEPRGKGRKLVLILTGFVLLALFAGAVSLFFIWRSNDYDFNRMLGARSAQNETTQPTSVPETQTGDETQEAIPITVFRVSALCRNDEGVMSFLYVFEVDVTGRSVKIIPMSADTALICSGKEMTAGEICSTAGYSFREAYNETYGRKIDKYIEMTETAFKALVKELGNVPVYVDKDVPYDEDGMTYTIRAGMMSLTPDMLLRYMKYADTPEELTKAQTKAAKAMFDTYITSENVLKGIDLFSKLANLVSTDITALEYNSSYTVLTQLVSDGITYTSDELQ